MLQPQSAAPTPPPLTVWASVRTFCQMAGIGKTTCYAAMNAGHIPARKIGGRTVIRVADGLAWVERQPAYLPN